MSKPPNVAEDAKSSDSSWRTRHRKFWQFPLHLAVLTAPIFGGQTSQLVISENTYTLLENHCLDCHDEDSGKGKVYLDKLESLPLGDRLDILNKVQEQIYTEEMPPRDRKKQPTGKERESLINWAAQELQKHNASKLEAKLRKPEYGNYVDHKKLFSREYKHLKGFSHDRRWLISEFIFNDKFNRILNHKPTRDIDGKRHSVLGDSKRRVNLTNPFLLPTHSGVRYYANETLNGGHLLTMLTNVREASTYMMYLAGRDARYLPAVSDIMALENQQKASLKSREDFLSKHIERELKDLYEDKHDSMLPEFVRVDVPTPIPNDGSVKKAPFHAANPGKEELVTIFRSMRRLEKEGQTDAQLIEACEREWFYYGHNSRAIQARVTFLQNYMEEWCGQIEQHKYYERNRPYEYKDLAEEEMQIIRATLVKNRKQGDPYLTIISKCMEQWEAEFEKARIDAGPPNAEQIHALVKQLFVKILERSPTEEEVTKYADLTRSYTESQGRPQAIRKLMQTLLLNSEFVYRNEFGQGEADEHGRKMLSPRDASYAIAYALTDSSPDDELVKAVESGKLSTREDYRREVLRLLKKRDQYYVIDESVDSKDVPNFTNMPVRELRFFREFFAYPKMLPIFKDNKRFGGDYSKAKTRLVAEADQLVEHILEKDKDVFAQLLTTEEFYVYHSGDNESMQSAAERIRKIYDYFKDNDWQNFEIDNLVEHKEFIGEMKMRGIDVKRLQPGGRYNPLRAFKTQMESFTLRLDKGQTAAAPFNSFPAHGFANGSTRYGGRLQSPQVAMFYNFDLANWNYPTTQPAKVPHRKGILTHPAWLIAHAQNQETDPVIRGKWIREKLLAGTVQDVPITVDAVIPEDHHKALRTRLVGATEKEECWKCHQRMNPLGYSFEIYDDFGRYRTEESLEHPDNLVKKVADKGPPHVDLRNIYKTLPVNPKGALSGTGNPKLDGEVKDAIDLAGRLAKSSRVRQSIIRHAFRYFLGRNETLSDSKTLIDADQAYLESGGSFDAVIVSLLTSDSFIYRKPIQE